MILRLICFFMLCVGVLGCTPHMSQQTSQKTDSQIASIHRRQKILKFRIQGEPETLDWNLAHTPIETHLLVNLMEGLVSLDSQLKVVPALAERWEVSHHQTTYTFHLRPGVKWSDGKVLRAQDFLYSWKRLLEPQTAAPYAYFLYDIVGAKDYNRGLIHDFNLVGIKVLDELTLQVELNQPIPSWVYIPSFWVTFPLRQDIVEKYGKAWTEPGNMVTLGPYLLKAHELDSKITLQAYSGYYGQRGNLDQIEVWIVSDDVTALNLYQTGKLDFLTDISDLDLKRLKGSKDLKIFPYLKTVYMGFVLSQKPASYLDFRRAVAMAIDKSRLQDFLHGGQKPASSFVPPPLIGSTQEVGVSFDPKKARDLVKKLFKKVPLPQHLQVDFIIPNYEKSLTVAQFIQSELKKNLGLEIVLQSFDNKTYRARLDLHQIPLFLTSWSGDFPDPDNFLSVFLSDSGNNRTTWKNGKYDQLTLTARESGDSKRRQGFYLQLQKILLNDEAVIVPLYYEPMTALIHPWVKNLEINPVNDLDLRKVQLSVNSPNL